MSVDVFDDRNRRPPRCTGTVRLFPYPMLFRSGVLAFAVRVRAARRVYPLVMVAAMVGYLIRRSVGGSWGSTAGIFMSALVLTAAGNAYARWAQRPGALVRVPGIILMVPGSASVRSVLTLIQQQDLEIGRAHV